MATPDAEVWQDFQENYLESQLLQARKVFLRSPIDAESAQAVVTRLLLLDAGQSDAEIVLYINSTGGDMHAGLALYDAMQTLRSPVSTICTGTAAHMGALILAGGAAGRRFAWPHARIMLQQPLRLETLTGAATDIDIHAREMLQRRDTINRLYAHHTGQAIEKIAQDTRRDHWLSAVEAKDYGVIDAVLTTR
jgi:ATP-dependent Clp protease protease subunit